MHSENVVSGIGYAVALIMLTGCGETRMKGNRSVETKPIPQQIRAAADQSTMPGATQLPVIRGQYRVKIHTRNGVIITNTQVCDGMATLLVNERTGGNYDVELTDPNVRCLGGILDLSILLAGLMKKETPEVDPSPALAPGTPRPQPQATSENGVISFDRIFAAQWSPPRPVVVGPLIQNVALYQGLDRSGTHVLLTQDAEPTSTSGTLRVRVHETRVSLPITLPAGRQLADVMHWSIASEGFRGVKRAKHFLFDEFHVYVNVRPIVVAKISIVSSFDDLLGGGAATGFGGFLVRVAEGLLNVAAGRAEIELEAMDWNIQ